MTLDDVYEFANINPLCYLATTEGDQPRVRAFTLWYAADKGFYFHTQSPKDVYQQIMDNPKVEVCFYATQSGAMMRIEGRAVVIDDLPLKAKLLEDQEYLKAIVSGPNDPMLILFRVEDGEARFWTIGDNARESESQRIKF